MTPEQEIKALIKQIKYPETKLQAIEVIDEMTVKKISLHYKKIFI